MKNFMYDLCLVLFLICVISLTFGNNNVSDMMFERSINEFEDSVSTSQTTTPYVTIQDTSDNHVSSLLKTISHGCVKVIEFIVLVFSNLVSMIITVML